MRICIVVQRRHVESHLPAALVVVLRDRGHHVDVWIPEETTVNLGTLEVSYELYVARCRSASGMAALAVLDARGAKIVNRFRAIEFSSNKAITTATLRARRIPHPPTFLAERPALLRSVPADAYPLVIKPLVGEAGEGVRLLRSRRELDSLPERPVYAQRYVSNAGYDLKAYVVGESVRLVRKPSPLHGGSGPTEELPVPLEVERLALLCGRLFGLEIYGVDLLRTDDGWQVVEVNDFPSFTAIPDPAEWIAGYLLGVARQTERPMAEVY